MEVAERPNETLMSLSSGDTVAETDSSEHRSVAQTLVAIVAWLLIAAGVGVVSLYGSLFLVRALVFRWQVSAWGWEYLYCVFYAPVIGLLTYFVCFAFFRRVAFLQRCCLNAAIGSAASWAAMLLFYSLQARQP